MSLYVSMLLCMRAGGGEVGVEVGTGRLRLVEKRLPFLFLVMTSR